jgi:hypothetical protein
MNGLNPEDENALRRIMRYLAKKRRERFFGTIEIKMQNGMLGDVYERRTWKQDELPET